MKKVQFKISALLVSLSVVTNLVFAELSTDKAVILNNGTHRVKVTANFSTPVTGDFYLATQVNNSLVFFTNEGKELSHVILPYTRNSEYFGEIILLDFPALLISSGRYPVYQVVTKSGSNPLHADNWVGGRSGLNVINLNIGLPCEISGDFDEDGFADDDLDRDGFHDDDLNRDGFHDDDLDHDGFHDNDFNRDGVI